MFILRRITVEGIPKDVIIGKEYSLVLKFENKEEYEKTLKAWLKGLKRGDEDVYGFIIHNNGQRIITLYKKSIYFIMCSDGKTFANITLK